LKKKIFGAFLEFKPVLTTVRALQFAQVYRQVTLLVVSILLTKTRLPISGISVYEALLFLGSVLSFFWVNALLQTALIGIPKCSETYKKVYFNHVFTFFTTLTIALGLVLFFADGHFIYFFTGKWALPHLKAFAVIMVFNTLPLWLEVIWTLENKPHEIFRFSLFSNTLQMLAIVLPIFQTGTLMPGIIGFGVVAFLKFLVLLFILARRETSEIKFNKKTAIDILNTAMPLLGYAFLGGFAVSFSAWFVGQNSQSNDAMFAIFRYGTKEFPLILALSSALSAAFLPTLSHSANKNKENKAVFASEDLAYFRKETTQLWHLLFPVSILLMFASKPLFTFLLREELVPAAAIFNVTLLLLLSRALFTQTLLLALGETKISLAISVLETFLLVFLTFVLGNIWGLKGVALATVLAFLFEKILIGIYLKFKYNIGFENFMNLKLYYFYSAILLAAFWVSGN
jgi:O-antigen/teichoic acid export membrane protein